ncbi:MAG: hypothetical protein RIG63_11630 [Coleofasciculus chthonoplastes F3-SA18-01]|uniref:hypothetical protein n=1 Tax=Coleofasciculus chthonoplastes TaxID=64178 RepID=UPI0032F81F07
MTHTNLLELAKQGNDAAILSVMNYVLQDRNITAQAALKGNCLLVLLKAVQVPDQKLSVTIVRKLMAHLRVPSIASVQMYGKQVGQPAPSWMEVIDLRDEIEPLKPKTNVFKVLAQWRTKPLMLLTLIPLGAISIYAYLSLPLGKSIIPVQAESISFSVKEIEQPTIESLDNSSDHSVSTSVDQPQPSISSSPMLPSPTLSSQPEPFQNAVNQAMHAATLTQSAQTPEEWDIVVSHWQDAIALMDAVPPSHPQHSLAQQKVIEYQENLNYAQKNTAISQ